MTRQKHRTAEDQQRWQAEQAARTTALVEQREAGIQAIPTSADFERYLAAKCHAYSLNNVLMIFAQDPTDMPVAGSSPGKPMPATGIVQRDEHPDELASTNELLCQ